MGLLKHELKGVIDNIIFSHGFHASWSDSGGQIENFPFLFLADLQLYFPFLYRHELAYYKATRISKISFFILGIIIKAQFRDYYFGKNKNILYVSAYIKCFAENERGRIHFCQN